VSRALCAVSVDLDPLRCYYEIHGLGAVPPQLADVVLRKALPRFAEVFARHRLPATLFVVGADVAERSAVGRAELTRLAAAGHELGNHSHTHPYALARLDEQAIDAELAAAERVIGELADTPVGFRSPGYDLSPALLRVLERRGYRYDSSVFPSWPYYLAKAGVMGVMALTGRRSGSVIGDPRALAAPTEPYHPGATPWTRGQSSVVELPITVTRGLRFPGIGTWILTAPNKLRLLLLDQLKARRFFNFELHGLDLLDADTDGIPAALVARQPDLRVPLERKLTAFSATLDRLRLDYDFMTLRDVAAAPNVTADATANATAKCDRLTRVVHPHLKDGPRRG
jgi:peptidoglycan/xylan/chitin deacetylase (PgdA/CDA1 family)